MQKHINPEEWKAPRTFEQYFAQFPQWHKQWLNKRYPKSSNEDFQDVAQHLLVRSLETRRVEKYAPIPELDNRPALFFHYMGMCFGRDLASVMQTRKAEKRFAISRPLSLDSVNKDPEIILLSGSEALDTPGSSRYKQRTKREGNRAYAHAAVSEFRAFVRLHRPDLLHWLDGDWNDIERNVKTVLKRLAEHFEHGTIPGRSFNKERTTKQQRQRRWRKKYYRKNREKIKAKRDAIKRRAAA